MGFSNGFTHRLGWFSVDQVTGRVITTRGGRLQLRGPRHAQELLEKEVQFVQPAARRNEVLGWVKSGLRDFSISRAAVAWGIPIPRDPSQTVYVWFDALLGYASG